MKLAPLHIRKIFSGNPEQNREIIYVHGKYADELPVLESQDVATLYADVYGLEASFDAVFATDYNAPTFITEELLEEPVVNINALTHSLEAHLDHARRAMSLSITAAFHEAAIGLNLNVNNLKDNVRRAADPSDPFTQVFALQRKSTARYAQFVVTCGFSDSLALLFNVSEVTFHDGEFGRGDSL